MRSNVVIKKPPQQAKALPGQLNYQRRKTQNTSIHHREIGYPCTPEISITSHPSIDQSQSNNSSELSMLLSTKVHPSSNARSITEAIPSHAISTHPLLKPSKIHHRSC
eukprot:192942_1